MNDNEPIADALFEIGVSPNEWDSNLEAANIVDGLFAIARALDRIARQLEDPSLIADAIRKLDQQDQFKG